MAVREIWKGVEQREREEQRQTLGKGRKIKDNTGKGEEDQG